MIPAAMPRPRPPFLQQDRSRLGKLRWYVRKGKGPRIRIQGDYGSPEFMAAYHAAIAGKAAPAPAAAPAKPDRKSLAWLIDRHKASTEWAALSPATRRQRDNIFLHVIAKAGKEPFAKITRRAVTAGMDDRAKTPFAANNFLKTMRGLFRWALEQNYIDADPTIGIKGKTPKTTGFHVWTDDEIDAFEAFWPIGTRERLALALLLYTGLRRGDVARLGRQHIKGSLITIRPEKTPEIVVTIPILPELAQIIAASPTGDLALIATAAGQAMVKESFGNWFSEAARKAGCPGSAHGLRKAGAARAAANGATVAQLNAIYGWRGFKMAAHYTETADRARLAGDAIAKLVRMDDRVPVRSRGKK